MSVVRYQRYGSVVVSKLWKEILDEADRQGVGFHVTSGHRTIREQQELFNQNMTYAKGRGWVRRAGRPLTSWPSATSPHIRINRPDHAIDVDALDGGAKRLSEWLGNRDVPAIFPVYGEPWHLEAPRKNLERYRKRVRASRRRRALRTRRAREIAAAAKFIAGFEGFRASAYKPVKEERYWTIGYGHYGADVRPGQRITKAKALALLVKDVTRFYDAVVTQFPQLSRNQRIAITSATFNLGLGVLEKNRSLGLALRTTAGVPAALKLYNKGANRKVLPGLVRRRAEEADLYTRK